jgi:hypothetical protein
MPECTVKGKTDPLIIHFPFLALLVPGSKVISSSAFAAPH